MSNSKYRIIDLNNNKTLGEVILTALPSERNAIKAWCDNNGHRINLKAELIEIESTGAAAFNRIFG